MMNQRLAREIVQQAALEGIRFRTFHVLKWDGYDMIETGKVSVAVIKNRELDFTAGLAFCSPNDSYSRKVGHALAAGRLDSKKAVSFSIPEKASSVKEKLKQVVMDYVHNHEIGWMKDVTLV